MELGVGVGVGVRFIVKVIDRCGSMGRGRIICRIKVIARVRVTDLVLVIVIVRVRSYLRMSGVCPDAVISRPDLPTVTRNLSFFSFSFTLHRCLLATPSRTINAHS